MECECFHCGLHCLGLLFAKSIVGWGGVMVVGYTTQEEDTWRSTSAKTLEPDPPVWQQPKKQTSGARASQLQGGGGALLCCVLGHQLQLGALPILLKAFGSGLVVGPNTGGYS